MADNNTSAIRYTNTPQQLETATTPVTTGDQGPQRNSPAATETTPTEPTTDASPATATTSSIAVTTTNSSIVPKETTNMTEALPPPPSSATTTQAPITTTEAPAQTNHPTPTAAISTETFPTATTSVPFAESIHSSIIAPTVIVPGIVSSFGIVSPGLPVSSSVDIIVATSIQSSAPSCVSSNSCTTADIASPTISTGQIAGIAVGAIAFASLLGACLFIIIRKKRRDTNNYRSQLSKRVSPFFFVVDGQEKEPNSCEDNSRIDLYHSSENSSNQMIENNATLEMSESAYFDNIFYSNSADYCRTSSIMNVSNNELSHSKDDQIGPPASLYPHTAKRYNSYSTSSESTVVMNSKASPYHATASSAQLHQKYPINKQQQQGQLPYTQSARSSTEIDTDSYTLSAMQLFRDSGQTNTTSGTRSMVSSSIISDREAYRPSLNHGSMFHSSSNNMESCITGSPMTSSSLRFSHHRRQESSLDPQILSPPMQQKMSLWDDHV